MPENYDKLKRLGREPGGMLPNELAAPTRAEIPRLGKVVQESGAHVD
jgi:hypothetical protein